MVLLVLSLSASAQKIKVIVDQDARGPGTSDQQAILVFLQSDKFEVLGITTVSGDQWVRKRPSTSCACWRSRAAPMSP